MELKKDTIARTAVLFLALGNQVLLMTGKHPLPWSEDEIYQGISALITVGASVWSWWKNNSFTNEAKQADEYLKQLKGSNSGPSETERQA